MLIRACIISASETLGGRLAEALRSPDVHIASRPPEPGLWGRLAREGFQLIVADAAALPRPADDLLESLRAAPEHTEVVVVVDSDDPETRAGWLEAGAMSVVSRFASEAVLRRALRAIVRRLHRVGADAARAGKPVSRLGDFVSQSVAMNELLDLARRVAATQTSLLVLGETGVGKEWLARAIHEESPRSAGPFVAVNCAAIPEGLLESELFGHVEGAFTGALRNRRGHFELAHGGTLFLDEISDMPIGLQAKLLRALQERTIQPLGSEELVRVDARLMAATNRELEGLVKAGEFRSDLYYRLGVVSLTVPPLRERQEDIPALVETYRERFAIQFGRSVDAVTPRAMESLVQYGWPGNVRELINVLERGVLLCAGSELDTGDLPRAIVAAASVGSGDASPVMPAGDWLDRPLAEAREELVRAFERRYLAGVLERCAGRVGEAARHAGIDPRTLYNKMRRYGLEKERFRSRAS